MLIRQFHEFDTESVVLLWDQCGLTRPWNDPQKDVQRKLRVQPDLFLVAEVDGVVIGTVMAGYEGHRGWINYLAVAPAHQRTGLGRELMTTAETRLRLLGCPKINLQVRAENEVARRFYEHLGFTEDRVLSFGKRLENDGPPHGAGCDL